MPFAIDTQDFSLHLPLWQQKLFVKGMGVLWEGHNLLPTPLCKCYALLHGPQIVPHFVDAPHVAEILQSKYCISPSQILDHKLSKIGGVIVISLYNTPLRINPLSVSPIRRYK